LPEFRKRPFEKGPGYFVDPVRGKDDAAGSEKAPWRSVNHALKQLKAGDTLYLRGGVYYESVLLDIAGTAEKPITIRSFPGELAILDAGKRSATVVADDDVVCAVLSASDFDELSRNAPAVAIKILTGLGRELSGRLRRANTTIHQLES